MGSNAHRTDYEPPPQRVAATTPTILGPTLQPFRQMQQRGQTIATENITTLKIPVIRSWGNHSEMIR